MIALITATWDEIRLLKQGFIIHEQGSSGELNYIIGDLHGTRLVLAEIGVGIRRARSGASLIIQKFKPSHLIVGGFGGALNPELKLGDIVIGEVVLSLKKNETQKLHSNLEVPEINFKKGLILSESRFIHNPVEKKKLFELSKALVVDMETWGVIEAAQQSRTPVVSVRAVSDEAHEKLPDMAAIYGKNGKLDFEKTDKYFKEMPDLMSPYLKFRFNNSPKASHSLCNFLDHLISNL